MCFILGSAAFSLCS